MAQTNRVRLDTLLQGYRLDTDQGAVGFCAVTLLEAPDAAGVLRRVVVDTGHTGRRGALQAALAERGLSGDDIDYLALTHAHWDHIENLDLFGRLYRVESRALRVRSLLEPLSKK